MNGFWRGSNARGWRAPLTSLPVPLLPVMRTLTFALAILCERHDVPHVPDGRWHRRRQQAARLRATGSPVLPVRNGRVRGPGASRAASRRNGSWRSISRSGFGATRISISRACRADDEHLFVSRRPHRVSRQRGPMSRSIHRRRVRGGGGFYAGGHIEEVDDLASD